MKTSFLCKVARVLSVSAFFCVACIAQSNLNENVANLFDNIKMSEKLSLSSSKKIVKIINDTNKNDSNYVNAILQKLFDNYSILKSNNYYILKNIDRDGLTKDQSTYIKERLDNIFTFYSVDNYNKYILINKFKITERVNSLIELYQEKRPVSISSFINNDLVVIDSIEKLYAYIALSSLGIDTFESLITDAVLDFYHNNYSNQVYLYSLMSFVNEHLQEIESHHFIQRTAILLKDKRAFNFGHGNEGTIAANYLLSISSMLCNIDMLDVIICLEEPDYIDKYYEGIKSGKYLCRTAIR